MLLWFYSFRVSWFKKSPNVNFIFSGSYWSHIQDFQDFIKRIVGFVRRPSFPKLTNLWVSENWRFAKITCFGNGRIFSFWFFRRPFLKCPGVSKDEHVLGNGDGFKNLEITEMKGFLGSRINKSRFYYTKSKQNNSPELLNLLFKHLFLGNNPKMTGNVPIVSPMIFLCVFLWFSYDSLAAAKGHGQVALGTKKVPRTPPPSH